MTTAELFDLVAPIAITGSTDLQYHEEAMKAWRHIVTLASGHWRRLECPIPADLFQDLETWDIRAKDDFDTVHRLFAVPAYNQLFRTLVKENGDGKWREETDHWGSLGYRRPHTVSVTRLFLAGDSHQCFAWYADAAGVLRRMKEIEQLGKKA